MISYSELINLLATNNIENLSESSTRALHEYFCMHNLDYNTCSRIINGAKITAILSEKAHGEVIEGVTGELSKSMAERNLSNLEQINNIYEIFNSYKQANPDSSSDPAKTFKQLASTINEISDSFNQDLLGYTQEQLDELYSLACIYKRISYIFGNDKIASQSAPDYIFNSKINEMLRADFMIKRKRQIDHNRFDEFIKALEGDESIAEAERFTNSDIKTLIKKSAKTSLLIPAQNFVDARDLLIGFLEELKNQPDITEEQKQLLDSTSAKSIIKKANSILMYNKERLSESINMMSGRPFVELNNDPKSKLAKVLPNLTIDGFDTENKIYYLLKCPKVLVINGNEAVENKFNTLSEIIASAISQQDKKPSLEQKVELLRESGYVPEKLLHADNLRVLTSYNISNYANQIKENIVTLQNIISPANIQKIIMHNIELLTTEPADLAKQLVDIIDFAQASQTPKLTFKNKMEEFVNEKFIIDVRGHKEGASSSQANTDPIQKVDLDEMRDYIELDMDVENVKQKTPVQKDYKELLFDELMDLNAFIDNQNTSQIQTLDTQKLGGLLNKIYGGTSTANIKGALKQKYKQLSDYIERFENEGEDDSILNEAIISTIFKVDAFSKDIHSFVDITTSELENHEKQEYSRDKKSTELLSEYEDELLETYSKLPLSFVKQEDLIVINEILSAKEARAKKQGKPFEKISAIELTQNGRKIRSQELVQEYAKKKELLCDKIAKILEQNDRVKQNREKIHELSLQRQDLKDLFEALENIADILTGSASYEELAEEQSNSAIENANIVAQNNVADSSNMDASQSTIASEKTNDKKTNISQNAETQLAEIQKQIKTKQELFDRKLTRFKTIPANKNNPFRSRLEKSLNSLLEEIKTLKTEASNLEQQLVPQNA